MTDLFESDFYSPEIDFAVVPVSEERQYPVGPSARTLLRRATAEMAFAAALYLAGPSLLSDAVLKPDAIRSDHDTEAALRPLGKIPRRGKAIPSPISANVFQKAKRAGALFERVTDTHDLGWQDPDYGL